MATIPEAFAIAVRHHRNGQLQQAEQIYRQILQTDPNHADALHLLGVVAHQVGNHHAAIEHIGRAVGLSPNDAAFQNNLAAAYLASGQLDQAAASCRRALKIRPDYVDALNNLGIALKDQGKLDEAVQCYRQALQIKPDCCEAHHNLGFALAEQQQPEAAVASYRRALQIKPDYFEAHNNLGMALAQQGNLGEAVASYRRALQIKPDSVEAHVNLGNTFKDQGKLEKAVACYRRALQIKPDHVEAYNYLASALAHMGKLDEARATYQRALEVEPDQPLWELQIATLCPAIFASNEEIDEYRRRLTADLKRFSGLPTAGREPPFNLLYQGRNDRPIKEAYAKIFRGRLAERAPAARGGPPRVGFVVTGGHEGIFLKLARGILEQIDPGSFEVVVVCSAAGSARIRAETRSDSLGILAMPERFDQIVETIGAAEFDLLYHWEVGTDATNYFLPFARLAPVQCTSWGVPVTSGIPQMDYYLSSELLETEDAAEHYTEELVRLPTLPTYYYRPALPARLKERGHFGLADDRHVYLCPQSLLKFHPDFDRPIGEILRRDPNGDLIVIGGRHPNWTKLLQRRFSETIPDCVDRIRILPPQSGPDFLNMMALCDVLLDPFHFGGGNTTYEALSLGLPIVTFPPAYMRGRVTYACYRKMGVLDCVTSDPQEYVNLAVRLGTDRDARFGVRSKIRASADVLFEDVQAVRELERFFQHAVELARGSPGT